MNQPHLNTFDGDLAKRREAESQGKVTVKEVFKIAMVPINKVIAENFGGAAPDLLSIDFDGMEQTILQTLDYDKFRPKVICAATPTDGGTRPNATADFVSGKGSAI